MSIDKNDPRLTAFALGELPPEEAAELQAALKNDPTLAAEVEAIREVAEKLKTTLAEEPLPKPEPVQPLKTPKKRFPLIEIGVVVTVSLLLIALFLPTSRSAREAAHNLNGQMQPVELTSPAPRQEADISHEGLRCGHSISGSERKTDAFVDDNYSTTISVGDKKPIAFTADNSGEKALQRIAGPRPKQAIIHPAKKPTGKPGDTLELKDKSTKEIPSEAKFSRLSELRQKVRYGGNTTNKPAAGEPDMRMMVTPRVVIEQEEVLVADRMRQLSLRSPTGPHNTESYDKITENEFKRVAEHPLSTFSIDVDTASYSVVRKMLTQGRMPVPGAVRLEEMINYFDYSYQPPSDGKPF
ncbi:MAG: von Willebrand factor type A domain-containing protein, partial [Planctomycetota bacterium]|nr:von Willebrand factor type A domain-containing protein [Planctomycetota bacterium]